jgi:hypothetical protein
MKNGKSDLYNASAEISGNIPIVGNEWSLDRIYLAMPPDFLKGHDRPEATNE